MLLELPLPLGEVVAEEPPALPDGLPLAEGDVVVELEPEDVVSDDRGVVAVPGEADGLVRSGVLPTLSVSVRLHASVIPLASARAQRPDSNFFIADDPPLWGVGFDPAPRAATAMPVVRCEPASVTSCQRRSRYEARRLA